MSSEPGPSGPHIAPRVARRRSAFMVALEAAVR